MNLWFHQAVLMSTGSYTYTMWHHDPHFPDFLHCSQRNLLLRLASYCENLMVSLWVFFFFLQRNTKSGSGKVTWNNGCGITPEIFLDYDTDIWLIDGDWWICRPLLIFTVLSQCLRHEVIFFEFSVTDRAAPVCYKFPFCPYHSHAFGFTHHYLSSCKKLNLEVTHVIAWLVLLFFVFDN